MGIVIRQSRKLFARWGLVLALCLCATMVLPGARASAASSGITVSPAVQDITLSPTQNDSSFVITITNHNPVTQTIHLNAVDFGSLDESGGLVFIGSNPDSKQTKYGLSSWLQFDNSVLTLEPNQKKNAKVTIMNKESFSPGGHYAAVIVQPVGDDPQSHKDQVTVIPSASVLILLRKQGGEVTKLEYKGVRFSGPWLRFPDTIAVRFQNTGNVHVVPRGVMTVTDPRGHSVSKAIINNASAPILPESYRLYPSQLMSLGRTWLPGRYKIDIETRYDGSNTFEHHEASFWYIGTAFPTALVGLLILGVVLFLGIRVIHKRRKASKKKP